MSLDVLTALSGEEEVPGAFVSFHFFAFQLGSVLSAHRQHHVQLPPIQPHTAILQHTGHHSDTEPERKPKETEKSQSLGFAKTLTCTGMRAHSHAHTPTCTHACARARSFGFTSDSICAAARHFSAASFVLNWAKAQPGQKKKKKNVSAGLVSSYARPLCSYINILHT